MTRAHLPRSGVLVRSPGQCGAFRDTKWPEPIFLGRVSLCAVRSNPGHKVTRAHLPRPGLLVRGPEQSGTQSDPSPSSSVGCPCARSGLVRNSPEQSGHKVTRAHLPRSGLLVRGPEQSGTQSDPSPSSSVGCPCARSGLVRNSPEQSGHKVTRAHLPRSGVLVRGPG